jgi:hypothetical protein
MADICNFFVLAFSRTEASDFRAEVVVKALSEQHAESLAWHLAGERRGAVTFAQDASTNRTGDAVILGRYGDVPEDLAPYTAV